MIDLLEAFAVDENREPKSGLFIAGQFRSEVPTEINVLPKPGTYNHAVYGKVVVTRERNQSFIDNFNQEIYQKLLPIDLEHETQLSGACGYFEPGSGYVADDGSAWVKVRWEDRGAQALREGRFYYFSPTWFDKWREPLSNTIYENVLIGGALTSHPYFKDKALKPLYASELKMENNTTDNGPGGNLIPATFIIETASGSYTSQATGNNTFTFSMPDVIIKNEDPNKGKDMTEAIDPAKFKEMEEKIARFQELEAKAAKFAEVEDQLKKANEQLARQAEANRARHFKEVIRGIDAEGDGSKKFKGSPEVHATVLEALYFKFGEDSDEFKNYVTEMRALAEQLEASELLKEKGGQGVTAPEAKTAGDKAVDEWFAEVAKVMNERKVGEMDANLILAKENKELYQAYRAASYKKGEE